MTTSEAAADDEVWTVGRVLRWTQQKFAARGISSPRLDAELLLAHAAKGTLGGSRVALYTHFDKPLEKDALTNYRELIKRRLAGVPVAYLTGEKEFFGLPLRVSEAVLIPRPETELLVELALKLLPHGERAAPSSEPVIEPTAAARAEPGVELRVDYDEPEPETEPEAEPDAETASEPDPAASATGKSAAAAPKEAPAIVATVAEVGVGSGAVSLAIAHRRRDVQVIGIDASAAALAVAKENAQRLSLPVELHHGDLLSPLPKSSQLDLIVANLPYIPTAELKTLQLEVRSEPRSALDGGPDGLDIIRRLIAQALPYLRPGGALLLELGEGQAPAALDLLRRAGFANVRSENDLAGIARVVLGFKPGAR